jgi:hypothetical protein
MEARDGLIEKDMIAFNGTLFQVLDLPPKPIKVSHTKPVHVSDSGEDPAAIARIIRESVKEVR